MSRLEKRRLPGADGVELSLAGAERLAWLGAAYGLTARAFVAVGRRGRAWTVSLRPKRGARGLEAEFEADYRAQVQRWAVERSGRKARAAVLSRALELARGRGAGDGGAALPPARAAEIARLIAEPASWAGDPRGVATPWETLRARRAAA